MDHPKQGFRLSTLCERARSFSNTWPRSPSRAVGCASARTAQKKPRRSGAKRAKHGSPTPAQPATPVEAQARERVVYVG